MGELKFEDPLIDTFCEMRTGGALAPSSLLTKFLIAQVQGYLAHKKQYSSQDHHRAVDIVLR